VRVIRKDTEDVITESWWLRWWQHRSAAVSRSSWH